jgi:hypothetical protein
MTSRLETSFENLAGQTTPQGVVIERLVSKRPAVVWACKCAKCGSEFNLPHSRVRYAPCPSSACGQPLRKPSRLETERAAARERERIEQENGARLAALRMEEETADYRMPSSKRHKIEYTPMSAREQAAIRERREELEAEERLERERRERPIKEAEATLQKTLRKIRAVQLDTLTNPKVQDPDLWLDPDVEGMTLTREGVTAYVIDAFRDLIKARPGFWCSEKNLAYFKGYFDKHRIICPTAAMLIRLHDRLVDAGVVFELQPHAPEDSSRPDYTQRPNVEVRIAPTQKPKAQTFPGFDLVTGEPRDYTEREIDKMTSEEMKKALQMTTRGTLELPNTGPGPLTRAQRGV